MTVLRDDTVVLAQRMAALQLGNEIRLAGANERKHIRRLASRSGTRHVAELLESRASQVQKMPIGRLLTTIRSVGETKARVWCASADVRSLDRRVCELTDRQVVLLARTLRLYASGKRTRLKEPAVSSTHANATMTISAGPANP